MNSKITNIEKKEVYSNIYDQIKLSVNEEFYYEALVLSYAIMEDRANSILKHGKVTFSDRIGLSKKIEKIKTLYLHDEILRKYVSKDILNRIVRWSKDRNNLIHSLATLKIGSYNEQQIAEEGVFLANELKRMSQNYSRNRSKEKIMR